MNQTIKRIAIGADHAGYDYKEAIKNHLEGRGITVKDFGTHSTEPVDYPTYIRPVAEAVSRGQFPVGIVLGGSGNGEAIAANKVKGIRCALCWSEETARLAKEHNNANMISLGARTLSKDLALAVVDTWLAAEFQGGRHERRIKDIEPA